MATITLTLNDDLHAALEALCAQQGRATDTILGDLLRRYVDSVQLKQTVQDPDLIQLYQELTAEDLALAEMGMAECNQHLREADQS